MAEKDFLDYEGLKTLVKCVLAEIPKPDGTTIVENEDGSISAKTLYKPLVDTANHALVFTTDSPVQVNDNGTMIFV